MATRTVVPGHIAKGTTPIFKADLVDENGALITSLTTLTGTLRDVGSGDIINDRDSFDLSGSCSGGHFSWQASAEDTPIVNTNGQKETHRLTLRWTWSSGTKAGAHEIDHSVVPI